MATAQVPPGDSPPAGTAPRRSDRSPWNWLLWVPIVIPLLVPLYNRKEPVLFGWPAFYWVQLAFVPLGVITTVIVYQATRRKPEQRAGERGTLAPDRGH